MKNKEKFIISLVMFSMFGFTTELIATAFGGQLVGIRNWHNLTLMGHVSLWMCVVYITAFPLLNKLNDTKKFYKLPMIVQTIVGGFIIGLIELTWGILLNKVLGLNCWDYSINHTYHILGQICLQNYIMFTMMYPFAIYLVDKTEWILYRREEDEELLNYGILDNYKEIFILRKQS